MSMEAARLVLPKMGGAALSCHVACPVDEVCFHLKLPLSNLISFESLIPSQNFRWNVSIRRQRVPIPLPLLGACLAADGRMPKAMAPHFALRCRGRTAAVEARGERGAGASLGRRGALALVKTDFVESACGSGVSRKVPPACRSCALFRGFRAAFVAERAESGGLPSPRPSFHVLLSVLASEEAPHEVLCSALLSRARAAALARLNCSFAAGSSVVMLCGSAFLASMPSQNYSLGRWPCGAFRPRGKAGK